MMTPFWLWPPLPQPLPELMQPLVKRSAPYPVGSGSVTVSAGAGTPL